MATRIDRTHHGCTDSCNSNSALWPGWPNSASLHNAGKNGSKASISSPTPLVAKMINENATHHRCSYSRHLLHAQRNWKRLQNGSGQARRKNTSFNRHKFRQEKQKEGETVAHFVTRLRQLAALCDFPNDSLDSFICDQLIDNCLSKKLRTKLLAERDLDLDHALDIAQAMEASGSQSRQIAVDNQFTVYA